LKRFKKSHRDPIVSKSFLPKNHEGEHYTIAWAQDGRVHTEHWPGFEDVDRRSDELQAHGFAPEILDPSWDEE
jgi:hypothetical protein